jgi:hypothetical protein
MGGARFGDEKSNFRFKRFIRKGLKMNENIQSRRTLITNNLDDIQVQGKNKLIELLDSNIIDKEELIDNLQLFVGRQSIQRLLFLADIYKEIVNTHGIIMEFGVRWGTNISNLIKLRSILEPYNPTRKIVGFDTFSGFPEITEEDGKNLTIKPGSHDTTQNYYNYLDMILACHEAESPISQIKKFELVKGDATITTEDYLNKNPETLIALAYFDFDIYKPTKIVLERIKQRLVRNSVVVFDELCYQRFPGETIAFMEVLGANNYDLYRNPNSGTVSYIKYRGGKGD